MSSSRVRVVSAVVACCLATLPLAPTQHVHETEEHNHHELLVHSHSQAHHARALPGDHRGPTLDDEDTVVLTLDPVLASPHSTVTFTPALPIAFLTLAPQAPTPRTATPYVERQIHGPPRAPAVLRGPPSLSRL